VVDGKEGHFFPVEVAENVPKFLRWFGVACFLVGVFGVLLIFDPIEDEDLLLGDGPDGVERVERRSKIVIKTESLRDGVMRYADPTFRKVSVTMLFSYLYPHVMNFGFKSIGLLYLNDDSFVTKCGSMSAIVNAVSRFAFGHYFVKFGYKTLMQTIIGLIIINACTFVWFSHYHWTYLIAVLMFVLTYGGQLGSFPLVSDKLYGDRGALAYSILMVGFDLSNVLGLVIYSCSIDYIGWGGVLLIFAGLSLVPLLWVDEIDREIQSKKHIFEL
jgi:MFS family permease